MITLNKIGSGVGVLAIVIIIGGFVVFVGDAAIKTPMQWYNGKCSEVYTQAYRSKFQWFEPTCELRPESAEVLSEDDIEVLQNQLNDLKSQIEKTQELLKNSKKKNAD